MTAARFTRRIRNKRRVDYGTLRALGSEGPCGGNLFILTLTRKFSSLSAEWFFLRPRWLLQQTKAVPSPGEMEGAAKGPPDHQRPIGVNISGHLTGEFGLAEAGRALAKVVVDLGFPTTVNDHRIAVHSNRHKEEFRFSKKNPYRINLLLMNPDMYGSFFQRVGLDYVRGRANIGYWYWETPKIPAQWRPFGRMHREIWAATDFVARAIALATDVPVFHVPFPLFPKPAPTNATREEFGLHQDDFIFFFNFDYHSEISRKNPLGLINAFKQSFQPDERALLVLKTIHSERFPRSSRLLRLAARGARIRIMDEVLRADQMQRLLATSDCYVSLHRSEGLGLGLARAMSWGKPAIATAYSGNMDFMNEHVAFLVACRLVRSKRGYGPYPPHTIWAEPDLAEAARLMRHVFDHKRDAQNIGRRGSEFVTAALNPSRTGDVVRRRLNANLA